MKPPFNRIGSKMPILDKILPLIPVHDTYVECFVGSGAIFFNKEKAKKNVLNDLEKDVATRLKLLKSGSSNPADYDFGLTTLPKIKRFYLKHPNTTEAKIIYQKIVASTGYNNKPLKNVKGIYRAMNPATTFEDVVEYKDKLKGTTILSQDYEKVVDKYDSPTTFFFLDPPYENTNVTFGYAEDVGFDFERFAEVCNNIEGYVMVTLNDSPYIRKLFKGWKIKKILVPQSMKKDHIPRKELIIMNYK